MEKAGCWSEGGWRASDPSVQLAGIVVTKVTPHRLQGALPHPEAVTRRRPGPGAGHSASPAHSSTEAAGDGAEPGLPGAGTPAPVRVLTAFPEAAALMAFSGSPQWSGPGCQRGQCRASCDPKAQGEPLGRVQPPHPPGTAATGQSRYTVTAPQPREAFQAWPAARVFGKMLQKRQSWH